MHRRPTALTFLVPLVRDPDVGIVVPVTCRDGILDIDVEIGRATDADRNAVELTAEEIAEVTEAACARFPARKVA